MKASRAHVLQKDVLQRVRKGSIVDEQLYRDLTIRMAKGMRVVRYEALRERPKPRAEGRFESCACCGEYLGYVRLQEYGMVIAKDGMIAPLCRNCYECGSIVVERRK